MREVPAELFGQLGNAGLKQTPHYVLAMVKGTFSAPEHYVKATTKVFDSNDLKCFTDPKKKIEVLKAEK